MLCLENISLANIDELSSHVDELSSDVLRTIHSIISDDERDPSGDNLKSLSAILKGKLLATQSIASFRPRASIATERDVSEGNYLQHLDHIKHIFQNLPVDAETRRITEEIIFPGMDHLTRNIEIIVEHVAQHYGALYYLVPEKLPLHTDHTAQDTEAFRATLHRLLKNVIGAFYCCETAGQLPEFFNRLGHGYCFEGRVRDTLAWAINFSEIKTFDEFMESVVLDYTAYSKVMHKMSDESLSFIEPALAFIISRYKNYPCKAHEIYAPGSEIKADGVRKYLTDILAYSPAPSYYMMFKTWATP